MTAAGRRAAVAAGAIAACAAALVVVYWPTLSAPFVQDDWFRLESDRLGVPDGLAYAGDVFVPDGGNLFYRPLGLLAIYAVELASGLNPAGYHAVEMLLHLLTGLVAALIAYRLTRDRVLAACVGVVAAAALVIRIVPSLWMVGIYDLLGTLLFGLALLLFIDRRVFSAALAVLAALLVKENSVLLVVVLAAYHLLYRAPPGRALVRGGAFLREVGPSLAVTVAWAVVKLQNSSPFADAAGVYRSQFGAETVFGNLERYLGWSGRVLIPSGNFGSDVAAPSFTGEELGVAGLVVLAVAAAAVALDRRRGEPAPKRPRPASLSSRDVVFLVVWFLAALAPVLAFVSSYHAYYLVYGLPAFLILAFGAWTTLLGRVVRDPRITHALLVVGVAVGLVTTTVQAYTLERSVRARPAWALVGQGLTPFALGQTVDRVDAALERAGPAERPRGGWTVVFHLVDPAGTFGAAAFRVWFDEPSIELYPSGALEIDGQGVFVRDERSRRHPLTLARTLLVQPVSPEAHDLVVVRSPELVEAIARLPRSQRPG